MNNENSITILSVYQEQFMFIALEGIDGSGHTTQARLLARLLSQNGKTVYTTAEPSNSIIGKIIRDFLQNKVKHYSKFSETLALLFAADRVQHFYNEIKPKLDNNMNVICDRYLLSSLVYQGLWISEEWVQKINQFAPIPDLTILINTPLNEAKIRRKKRGGIEEIFESQDLQKIVQDRYLKLASKFNAIIIDGSGTQKEVTDKLIESIKESSLFTKWNLNY